MAISVVLDDCIGCGVCAATCPAAFEMDGDKVKVTNPDCTDPTVKEAVEQCPVTCIKV